LLILSNYLLLLSKLMSYLNCKHEEKSTQTIIPKARKIREVNERTECS